MTSDEPTDGGTSGEFRAGLGNIPPAALGDHAPRQRRRWPWVVVSVVLLLVGFVAAAPSLLSTGWLNGKIRSYLKDNLQAGTAIDFGSLDVSWSDGIRLTDLSIRRSARDDEPLLHAPLVEFDADVWPLLLQRLDVRKFVFHDPVVRIERTREGALNTEDVVKTSKKGGKDGEQGGVVYPEIDVPVEVHGLRLVIVGDDGRAVERGGVEFSGHLTTRKGPTTFDLHVPVGGGKVDVKGTLTLFDADGVLRDPEAITGTTVVELVALDAAENSDLIGVLVEMSQVAFLSRLEDLTGGVLDGRIDVDNEGLRASGLVDVTLRDVAMRGVRRAGGTGDDLHVTGAFRLDGDRFEIRDGLVNADGLEARAAFAGTLAAADGEATFSADLERGATALRAMGVDVPAGVGGRVTGRLAFEPSPSRGIGTVEISDLRVPAAVEGREPLAVDRVTAEIVVVPGEDAVTIERASAHIPDELDATLSGSVGHDLASDLRIAMQGHVPAILRRAKAMGLVPQDVAIAGSLDGAFALTWSPADARPSLTIEHASLRDEGVLVEADGTFGSDGALHLRVSGEGAIERLLAAGGGDERLDALKGTFAFAATADGPPDALSAELRSLRLDGDLDLTATGRMRPDGRIEGAATLEGRIPDAVALARGLGLVEGEVPLDGRIHGDLRVGGSRERPEIPNATLKIDGGPLLVDVSGSISELGSLQGTLEATADLDTLLRVAHAQGALVREHAPGGELRVVAAVAGTREKPEVPTAAITLSGPLAARADCSLDVDGGAHVRVDASGALQPLAALLAAVQGGDVQPLSGAYEAALSLDGPLDAAQVRLSKLLVRSEGLTIDAGGALRPGGAGDVAVALRGPLEGAFAIAHAFGLMADVSGTGSVDVALDARLSTSGETRTVSGSVSGTLNDLVMLRADTPEAVWRETHVTFSVPSFTHVLAAGDTATPQRPIPFELDTGDGLRARGRATGGTGGLPLDLRLELKGPVQPMIDAAAVFTGGGAGVKIGGSVATKEPLEFRGDVSAGRELAEGWTGTTLIELTDIVAPYVAISSGTVRARIAKGLVHLDPVDVAINGGTATGTATLGLVGEKPEHVLKLNAQDVRIDADLAPLLARAAPILAVGDAGNAGGKAGIDVELTAKGLDAEKLRETVGGNGVMHLDGVYAESRNWIGKLLEFAGTGTRLDVPRADVPFTVKRGKVTTENVDMLGSALDLRLGGEIGLDGTIDYAFLVKPKGDSARLERFAKLLDADGYVPLRLQGDLASPSLKLPSLGDAVKSGLGGLLEDVLNRDKAKEEEEKRKQEQEEEERRKRREERKKRKQEQGGDEPPPDDGADTPK